jgi:hypothetical protein
VAASTRTHLIAGVTCLFAITAGGCYVTSGQAVCRGCGAQAEPRFPTSPPSRSPTASPPTRAITPPGTTTAAPPPGLPQELDPDQFGNVLIQDVSGNTRCLITPAQVSCESQFTNAPAVSGLPANGINVNADGSMQFIARELGALPAITLDNRTYLAIGWTIVTTEDGTRLTNDRTGHGMFVTIDRVEVF